MFKGDCGSGFLKAGPAVTLKLCQTPERSGRRYASTATLPPAGHESRDGLRGHSLRRATIGSTFVARRAGRNEASSPTMMSTPETLPKVTKSVAVTP